MNKKLKRSLAAPFVFLAAVLILIEDWLWDDLALLAANIGRLPVLRQLEVFIAGLPPYGALATFAAPSLLLIPVKLLALYFVAHGEAAYGLMTVILAKVVGTALVARIFILTRSKLLQISWFARTYERFTAFQTRVHEVIRSSAIYQTAHRQYQELRARAKAFFQQRRSFLRTRWDAARRLKQRWKAKREERLAKQTK